MADALEQSVDPEEMETDVVDLTRQLIRIDTSNFGPSTETVGEAEAAQFCAEVLRDVGWDPEVIVTTDDSRRGMVLRIPGTDPNAAVVNVKTRVDAIMNNLPELVQREGIIITPIQPSILMYVNLFSTDQNADEKFLYNYANVNIIPELQRIHGMGRAQILG
ncbi:MAG: efflux RND transporter permease subunit, partial [Candidatus Nanopelagicales bacterium]